MSINTLTNTQSGRDAHLNIGSDTIVTTNLTFNYDVREVFIVEDAGPDPFTLDPFQMISGLVILQSNTTGDIICPSSAAIDQELGIAGGRDGYTIWLDIVNRVSTVSTSRLIPPDSGTPVVIPKAQSSTQATYTRFFFLREVGVWGCINS